MLVACPYPAVNVLGSALPLRHVVAWPGHRRSGHVHAGIDMGGQRGEAVLAMAAGTVRQVRAHLTDGRYVDASPRGGGIARASAFKLKKPNGAGLLVELVHPPIWAGGAPLHTVYMHMDTVEVHTGAEVEAGQTLGGMGASGVASDVVHVHFETYAGPANARGDARACLNPLGFQLWTSARKLGGTRTDRPGPGYIWPLGAWVIAPCFPISGTSRGHVGIDGPLPLLAGYPRLDDGTALVASPSTVADPAIGDGVGSLSDLVD